MKSNRKTRVFVGIPCGDHWVTDALAGFLFELGKLTLEPKCPFAFHVYIEPGTRPQQLARNNTVAVFLDSDCELFWGIDSDMYPSSASIRILQTDADIVGGRQLIWDHEHPTDGRQAMTSPSVFRRNGEDKLTRIGRLAEEMEEEVDAVGFGSVLIKRHVLEDERMRYGPSTEGEPPAIMSSKYSPCGRVLIGVDVDFCLRAKALGYTVKVNWAAEIGHFKQVELTNVELFARRQWEKAENAAQQVLQTYMEGTGSEPLNRVRGDDDRRGPGPAVRESGVGDGGGSREAPAASVGKREIA